MIEIIQDRVISAERLFEDRRLRQRETEEEQDAKEANRETDRQIERQTETDRDRQTDSQPARHRESARGVLITQLCTSLQCHFIRTKPHMYGPWASSSNLVATRTDPDLSRATAIKRRRNVPTDTEGRISTESWRWRRKLSRCPSCRESNPRPFDHEPALYHWAVCLHVYL